MDAALMTASLQRETADDQGTQETAGASKQTAASGHKGVAAELPAAAIL
jgi:hypothetical protein